MFIFLLIGEHFLLLFLFATIEISSHVDVGVVSEMSETTGIEVTTLTNQTSWAQIEHLNELFKSAVTGDAGDSGGAVKLIQPNLHMTIFIKYILILLQ